MRRVRCVQRPQKGLVDRNGRVHGLVRHIELELATLVSAMRILKMPPRKLSRRFTCLNGAGGRVFEIGIDEAVPRAPR